MKTSAPAHRCPVPPPLRYRMMHTILCPVMKLMGLSCRQFAELAAARMDRPLSGWESLRFRFHRAMCGLCRRLPVQLENLRTLTRCAVCDEDTGSAESTEPGATTLDSEALQRIREALERHRKGHSP